MSDKKIIRAGAPKKFETPQQLANACDKYFRSISRVVELTEKIDTGKFNKAGKPIIEHRPIINDYGKPATAREYFRKPSISGLCNYLHICRDTWSEYANRDEYRNICASVKQEIEEYLVSRLGNGKGDAGIQFELSQNYGWRNRVEVEAGAETRESMKHSNLSMAEKLECLKSMGLKVSADDADG